jgi:preprotein translocase subunit YajC
MIENMAYIFAGATGAEGGGGGLISTLIMFGAVILIMYFLMIRPQQKRQKEHQKMLDSIKKGDKVITSAGMHGTIVDIDEARYVIQVADNVKITFEKSAIASKKN